MRSAIELRRGNFRFILTPRESEGLTMFQPPPPEPPPQRPPIHVSEPLELRLAKFKQLLSDVAKKIEFAENVGRQYRQAIDPQVREAWYQEYVRQVQEVGLLWRSAVADTRELAKADNARTTLIIVGSLKEGLGRSNVVWLLDEAEHHAPM